MGPDLLLVGVEADQALPVSWRAAWHQADGRHHRIALNGTRYLLSCAAISDRAMARGLLLSIVPDLELDLA